MKLTRNTKEIRGIFDDGEFVAVIRKKTVDEVMDIQEKAVKMKDNVSIDEKAMQQNPMKYMELDSKMFRKLNVMKSLVKWNIEDDSSTDEIPVIKEINEKTLGEISEDIFNFLEKEIKDFSTVKAKDAKN